MLSRKGFSELGVRRVVAQTMAVNNASRRVLEKAGLSLRRTFHQQWPEPIEGAEQGEVEYALRKADGELQEAVEPERPTGNEEPLEQNTSETLQRGVSPR